MLQELNYPIAIATTRILLGILFLFQGYDKIFKVGLKQVRDAMQAGMGSERLHPAFFYFAASITSWVEFICGLLLVAGFLKYVSLYLVCANMLVLATGFSMARPMWENAHVFFRLTLVMILLMTPPEWDQFSLDHLISFTKVNP